MSMTEIERLTRRFADSHEDLSETIVALNAELQAVRRARLGKIKALADRAAEHKAELRAGIEAAKSLFDKPRTVIMHGIKVGFQKGKGSIQYDDPDALILRIERMYQDDQDQLDALINVTKAPNKTALSTLSAGDLRRLGCSVVDADDQVVIKPATGEVEKIVAALLKDAEADKV